MKSIVLSSTETIEIVDRAKPLLSGSNDVLVKIKYVGICGSDLHFYRTGCIGDSKISSPFILGHEASGIVEKVGNDVTSLKPGDCVTLDPAVPCDKCDQCLGGRRHTCRNMKFHGNPGEKDGFFLEYVVLPEKCCFKIPEEISLQTAALLEPLAVAVYTAGFTTKKRKNAAILGYGPIGFLTLLSVKQQISNANIFVTDKIDDRILLAKEKGAFWVNNPAKNDVVKQIIDLVPEGLDTVFECCGQQEAIDQAIDMLKPGGCLIIIGIPEGTFIYFDIHKVRRKEITIYNVRRQNESYLKAINLVASDQMNLSGLISHIFHYSQAQQAFNIADNYKDGVMKALIEFS